MPKSLKASIVGSFLVYFFIVGVSLSGVAFAESQRCGRGEECKIGEFLYDDTYAAIITDDICTFTSRVPTGGLYTDPPSSMTDDNSGWYSSTWTVDADQAEGTYPSYICCTPADEDKLCIDKTFVIGPTIMSATEVENAVWDAPTTNHTSVGSFGKLFGDLVYDIWNYTTRSLSTASLLVNQVVVGQLAVKSEVETAITSAQTSIKGGSNKDLTQLSSEVAGIAGTSSTIEGKVDALQTSVDTVGGSVDTLVAKWGVYNVSQIIGYVDEIESKLGTSTDTCAANSTVFSYVQCIRDKWGVQTAGTLYTAASNAESAATSLRTELGYGSKSTTAYQDLQTLKTYVDTLEGSIGSYSDTALDITIFGKLKKAQDVLDTLSTSDAKIDELLSKWGTYSATDIYDKVEEISSDISDLNSVSDISSILTEVESNSSDLDTLKNRILALQAIVEINRSMLEKISNQPIVKTWLEEGSIIFKTLATNPSSITKQTALIKFYLPKEAGKEDIIKVDPGLSVEYDPKEGAFYVTGQFELAPKETKVLAIEVEDIWKISDSETKSLRQQAEELSSPLKGSSNYAQGAVLKSDIFAQLDSIERLQREAFTPTARIKVYRENVVQLTKVKDELKDLKSLLAQVSSTGNLLGFIGGVQTFSVWGIVFVLISSFAFMLVYTKVATRRLRSGYDTEKKGKIVKEAGLKSLSLSPVRFVSKGGERKKSKVFLTAFLIVIVFVSGVLCALVYVSKTSSSLLIPKTNISQPAIQEQQGQPIVKPEQLENKPKQDETEITSEKDVLGSKFRKVTITIPSYSNGVNIREKPELTAKILTRIYINKSVDVYSKSDNGEWLEVGIDVEKDGAKYLRGWVFKQFTE